MTSGSTTSELDLSARAAHILEARNRAFRVLYDTVMEVEGVSEEGVYGPLCRNLRRICDARYAALAVYNPAFGTLTHKATDVAEGDKHGVGPCEGGSCTTPVSAEMMERYTKRQVRMCASHTACPMEKLTGCVLLGRVTSGDIVPHCLSCVREGRLIAVAKVYLPAGTKLKMKDIVDTYMNLAGMILQRVQAVRAVRESEQRFRDIVESMYDWVWEVNADGVYTYSSEKALAILGYSPEEIVGKTPFDLMPPEEAERMRGVLEEIADNVQPIRDLENWNRTKDGRRICLLTNGIPLFGERGEFIGYRGVDTDITERKRAEEELRKKNKRMEELNAELTILSRADPLTTLYNRRAWEEALTREHDRFRRHGCTYSIIMIDVDNFKAFNDCQGHQAGDECLRSVAGSIAASCRRVDVVGRYGGEEFTVLAPDTRLETGVKLAERIRKAIWALDLSHPCSPTAERVTISLGVAESTAGCWEHVLRASDDALYLAKRAGRNMVYGDRKVTSKLGQQRADDGDGTSCDAVRETRRIPARVLVVTDDPESRMVCTDGLEPAGYRVQHAADGEAALASISQDPPQDRPDVIIMDATLPGVDGLEWTRRLKADPNTGDIPVILASAESGCPHVAAAIDAGADESLVKPIQPADLVLRVRSMVQRSQDHKDLLRSFEVRGEHVRVLECLVEFCRVVGTSRNLDDVLEHTIAAVAELTQSRRISIMLPDRELSRLSIRKSMGIEEELADTIRVPVGEAVAGQVFASARPFVVNAEGQIPKNRAEYDSLFFASVPMLSTPLGAANRVVGVLNVTDRVGGQPFAQHELGHLELIAGIVSTAIHEISAREAHDRASESMMVALVRLAEHRDNDTGLHVDRVTQYCRVLAEELRQTDRFREVIDDLYVENLVRSAPLHDIGKVAIPDQILLHPGRLAEEKMAVMRTHSMIGAQTIRTLIERAPDVGFLSMAEDVAHYHHEWYNGLGYPAGLKGEAIPLSARIVALADVYDALVTKRVYKEMISHDEAVATIAEGARSQFDPDVVEAFIRSKEKFREIRDRCAGDGVI
ncbi:MAG: diguanylate cyclase [Phycisphaerae bacterium]|nr:diguanylate cyclase [Phycisphaerae bacterium]